MATREEVMATVERLIRRGELGEAAALLQMWTRGHPGDHAAAQRLTTVRELADPAPGPQRISAQAVSVLLPERHPAVSQDDPVARLQALLERIQINRR